MTIEVDDCSAPLRFRSSPPVGVRFGGPHPPYLSQDPYSVAKGWAVPDERAFLRPLVAPSELGLTFPAPAPRAGSQLLKLCFEAATRCTKSRSQRLPVYHQISLHASQERLGASSGLSLQPRPRQRSASLLHSGFSVSLLAGLPLGPALAGRDEKLSRGVCCTPPVTPPYSNSLEQQWSIWLRKIFHLSMMGSSCAVLAPQKCIFRCGRQR